MVGTGHVRAGRQGQADHLPAMVDPAVALDRRADEQYGKCERGECGVGLVGRGCGHGTGLGAAMSE